MDINQFIRIILRHIWLLISIPIILALIVIYLTRNPTFEFESNTRIYTGLASGSDLQQSDNIDYFATSNAFDNLINVIQSRETLGEVGIRLLAQGLVMDTYDPTYISKESFIELKRIVPQEVKDLVVKPLIVDDSVALAIAIDKTVDNFYEFKNSSDTNFIYNILNYSHKYYSIKALSSVNVKRIQNSDLIEIKYKSEDPGITYQTLLILTKVFSRNFKNLKENISDVVVAYFEKRVQDAQNRLRSAEDELLEFTTNNRIINYNEQTKFIASKKETIEEYIQNEKMKFSGAEEALIKLEEKLQMQGQIQNVSEDILSKRNRLVNITEKITINELYNESDTVSQNMLEKLKEEAAQLELEIRNDLTKLYNYRYTIEGLPISDLLTQWLQNLVQYAEAKAGLEVLETRKQEFMKNYEIYAPLGSKLKRIEREIDVAEREYLSLLHSLNLAKLEQQNQSIGTNIKPVDDPFFPISPLPTKRKILVIAAGFLGFILVLFAILAAEYFDNTIKTKERADKLTGLQTIGVYPRFVSKYRKYNLSFILSRLTDLSVQEILNSLKNDGSSELKHNANTIIITSTQETEGKSFVASKITNKLRELGNRVLYLNFFLKSPDSFDEIYPEEAENTDSSKINRDNLLYQIDDYFPEKKEILELISDQQVHTLDSYDFIILELPSILYYSFPNEIVRDVDLSIITVRANREWRKADQGAIDLYTKTSQTKPVLFLNATEINEVESKLGVLPKRRSKIRMAVKQLINMQFYSRQTIK